MVMFEVNFVFNIKTTAQFSAFESYFYLVAFWNQFINTFIH